jgi:hypothetical protein
MTRDNVAQYKEMRDLLRDPNKRDEKGVSNLEKARGNARAMHRESVFFDDKGNPIAGAAERLYEIKEQQARFAGAGWDDAAQKDMEDVRAGRKTEVSPRTRDLMETGGDFGKDTKRSIPNRIDGRLDAAKQPDVIQAEANLKNINMTGDVGKGFQEAVGQLSEVMKSFDPGKIMKDAVEAGTAMKLDSKEFSEGSKTFKEAVEKFYEAVKYIGADDKKMNEAVEGLKGKTKGGSSMPLDSSRLWDGGGGWGGGRGR